MNKRSSDNTRAIRKQIAEARGVPAQPERREYRFVLGADSDVQMRVRGDLNEDNIDTLIEHLELMKSAIRRDKKGS